MIESALYFALGFLLAGLVALLVIPSIWRRAERLTQRRIEASTPLSLAEIKAHRDQMRAEYARETRRLEMAVGEFRRRAAEREIEARRSTDRAGALQSERDDLAGRLAVTEQDLLQRIAEADQARRDRDDSAAALQAQVVELTELKIKLADLVAEIDTRKLEQAGLSARLEAAEAGQHTLAEEKRQAVFKSEIAEVELAKRDRLAADDQDRIRRLDNALAERSRDYAQKVEQLRQSAERLAEAESRVDRLESELRIVRSRGAGDNITATLEALERTTADLEDRVLRLTAERDTLSAELAAAQKAPPAPALAIPAPQAGAERPAAPAPAPAGETNAVLRERLADLAAQVVALTASVEGSASPITGLLGADPDRPAGGNGAAPQVAANDDADDDRTRLIPPPAKPQSLAERIRALQTKNRAEATPPG